VRVILADDDRGIREIVRLWLEQVVGAVIIDEVTDGDELCRLWHDPTDRPDADVVLIDQMMPGLTGVEAIARIRPADPTVHLVLFTAAPTEDLTTRAHTAGADDVVSKTDFDGLERVFAALTPATNPLSRP
jgi:CheY-like chemotaxis protein